MYDPLRAKVKVVFYSAIAFLFGLAITSGLGWTSKSYAMPLIEETAQVSPEAVQPALDLSQAFINLADAVTPAVVRIEARRPVTAVNQEVPDAFRRFFDAPEGQNQPPSQGQIAGGSGFVVSADGYILTNNHVVEGADEVKVYFPDRRYFDAEIIGTDPFTDVALIKVNAGEPLPALAFGNSDNVKVGEWILVILRLLISLSRLGSSAHVVGHCSSFRTNCAPTQDSVIKLPAGRLKISFKPTRLSTQEIRVDRWSASTVKQWALIPQSPLRLEPTRDTDSLSRSILLAV
jgi:hypothetical protein